MKIADYIQNYRDTERFLGYCKSCPNYSKTWSCPNFDFDVEHYFDAYSYIYILATKIYPSENESFMSFRGELDKKMLTLESEYPDTLALFAGSCVLCPECTRVKGESCVKPEQMRHSLEALGFDVSLSAKEICGIEIQWSQTPDYYTFVSALCSKEKLDISKLNLCEK